MIKFKRNIKTGILEAWKKEKKVGEVITMGDQIINNENIPEERGDNNGDSGKGKKVQKRDHH